MRVPSHGARPTRCRRAGQYLLAIGGALFVAATLTSARAEDNYTPRRLPPITAVYSAKAAPADGSLLADDPGKVVFAEQRDALAPNCSAPDAPTVVQTTREEVAINAKPTYQLLRFVDAPEPPSPKGKAADVSPFADEPEPPKVPKPLDDSEAADGDDEADGGDENKTEENAEGEPQTYGRRPTSYSLQFLRQQDVLLNPGDWQFDTGFAYTLFDNDFPLPVFNGSGDVTNVVEAHLRNRLIYTPLAFRYGWSDNVQLFAALPTGYSGVQLSTVGDSVTYNKGGIGDLTAGAQMHLIKGEDTHPDVVGTVAFTAPTGNFNAPVGSVVPGSGLGQGFWALSGQLLFINRYDPVIAFYGVGIRHLFEREFSGALFQPGEQFSYQFGVGFAANDRVTLSATFFGFFISNTLINRTALLGTAVEPMSLRFAATIARNKRIIEPFAQIGMTDFAPAASFGITITLYDHCDHPCLATRCP